MAKKARKRLEEEAEASAFEFPEFDTEGFLRHEFEQSIATGLALILAVALGVVSFLLTHLLAGPAPLFEGVVPAVVGIAVVAGSPALIGRLRSASDEYTKGDWVSLLLIEIFGWIGIWFLLTDVLLR